MAWQTTAALVGFQAFSSLLGFNAASENASFIRKQQAWQDKITKQSVKLQGVALDTNVVRARTEAADAMMTIETSSAEAAASARVQGAAAGVLPGGSYDTVLNSFARKENKAKSTVIQQLVSQLVTDKVQRQQLAFSATAGLNTTRTPAPSAAGFAMTGVANFFQQTAGLDLGLGGIFGGGNKTNAFTGESIIVA